MPAVRKTPVTPTTEQAPGASNTEGHRSSAPTNNIVAFPGVSARPGPRRIPRWCGKPFSYFDSHRDTVPSNKITPLDLMRLVTDPQSEHSAIVDKVRADVDPHQSAHKAQLPAVTVSGVMPRRQKGVKGLQQFESFTGFWVVDIDGVADAADVREKLRGDRHVIAAFVSPSGKGVKVLVSIADVENYARCFRSITRYFQEQYGMSIDTACKDLTRLMYLSTDPDAYVASGDVVSFEPAVDDVVTPDQPSSTNTPARQIVEGGRNASLARLAGQLRRQGLVQDEIEAALLVRNAQACMPPLPDAEVRGIAASIASYADGTQPWPPYQSLSADIDPPMFDPMSMIPESLPQLRDLIAGISTMVQVPIDMVAPTAVSIASLCTARSWEVRCASGWTEQGGVWVCILADPGERKSALLRLLAAPVYTWADRERERLAPILVRHMEQRRLLEARLASVRGKAARTTKRNIQERVSLERECRSLSEELARYPELHLPALITADSTPEATRDLLARNGEKVAVFAAEGDQFDVLMGRYNDGRANLGVFLSMHAGDACPAHRVGKDIDLSHPAGVVCMAVQPQAVETVLTNPDAVHRGLVPRFLWFRPSSWLGRRDLSPPPLRDDIRTWWAEVIHGGLDLPWPGRVQAADENRLARLRSESRVLDLCPEAAQMLLDLRSALEPRMNPSTGDLHRLSAFASKLPGACARIALTFQMLVNPQADAVDADCMRAACAWAPYLIAHTQAVVGPAADPIQTEARRIWRWIQAGQHTEFTTGACYRENRSRRLHKPESLLPVLDFLESHGLVRRVLDPKDQPGPRGRRWEVNPAALADSK